jgi:small neutral amino acid transporter SnatA (MarC family)
VELRQKGLSPSVVPFATPFAAASIALATTTGLVDSHDNSMSKVVGPITYKVLWVEAILVIIFLVNSTFASFACHLVVTPFGSAIIFGFVGMVIYIPLLEVVHRPSCRLDGRRPQGSD